MRTNQQNRFSCWRLAVVIAMLLPPALQQAVAQDGDGRPLSLAWQHATQLRDGVLTRPQESLLNHLAYESAVANVCEGFRLDGPAFVAAMDGLRHEDYVSMSAAEHTYFERHVTFNYGVAVGIFLAEAAQDPAAFCTEAQAYREDPEASHHWE